MDREETAGGIKKAFSDKKLLIECISAVSYHLIFILLAFIYMRGDDETLFRIGFIAAPIYIIVLFLVNLGEYIPWQVFWIFLGGAAVEFILNATHIIPGDVSIVLSGFGQSLWCAYQFVPVTGLFLFTLIPFLIFRRKAKRR